MLVPYVVLISDLACQRLNNYRLVRFMDGFRHRGYCMNSLILYL